MAEDLRHPTEEERVSLRLAGETGLLPTNPNLMIVMGLYAVVNRCQWYPVPEECPELAIPGIEALKHRSVDLGRHSGFWPSVFRPADIDPIGVTNPLELEYWVAQGGKHRLGQSNTGLDGGGVKIGCRQSTGNPEHRSFYLYPNTGSSEGDYDASIKLETRFAQGFSKVAGLIAENGHGQDRAWELLIRNCNEGSDLIGSADMLEAGWRT